MNSSTLEAIISLMTRELPVVAAFSRVPHVAVTMSPNVSTKTSLVLFMDVSIVKNAVNNSQKKFTAPLVHISSVYV